MTEPEPDPHAEAVTRVLSVVEDWEQIADIRAEAGSVLWAIGWPEYATPVYKSADELRAYAQAIRDAIGDLAPPPEPEPEPDPFVDTWGQQ